jgi:hypothetical protein
VNSWIKLSGLFIAAFVAWGLGHAYTTKLNPEIVFWRFAYQIKTKHSEKLQREGKAKWVIAGGSSSAFQVDLEVLNREHGMEAVNMGMHAGMGATVLSALAMEECRAGDTLVLMIEPKLFLKDLEISQLGYQACQAILKPEISKRLAEMGYYQKIQGFFAMRPGLYSATTITAKWLKGRESYRYQKGSIREGGQITTLVDARPFKSLASNKEEIPEASLTFLRQIRERMETQGVRVLYVLPWHYMDKSLEADAREKNHFFLEKVGTQVQVKDDGHLGVCSEESFFADTPQHMNALGAIERSRVLGALLNKRDGMEGR